MVRARGVGRFSVWTGFKPAPRYAAHMKLDDARCISYHNTSLMWAAASSNVSLSGMFA
jgi:hypothetical protein